MENEAWLRFLLGPDVDIWQDEDGRCHSSPFLTLESVERTLSRSEKYEPVRSAVKTAIQQDVSNRSKGQLRTCQLCSRHGAIQLSTINVPEFLGMLSDIFTTSNCPLCCLVRSIFYKHLSSELQQPGTWTSCWAVPVENSYNLDNGYSSDTNLADTHVPKDIHLWLRGETSGFRKNLLADVGFSIHRIVEDEQNSMPLQGRQIHSQIDIELAKSWLHKCQYQHGPLCENQNLQPGGSEGEHIRVIDVHHRRVVAAPKDCEFAALSYVWGFSKSQSFKSLRSNSMNTGGKLTELKLPLASELPATIEDAIYLTRMLNIDYLWIDALCIVQDDLNHKAAQIPRMADIYSSALVTIIAAGGKDAQAPLPGLRPQTRFLRKETEVLGNDTWAEVLPRGKKVIDSSVWNSRAWTFQEMVLSRRCLIFTQTQTYFHCAQEAWCEDTHAENLFKHAPMRVRSDLLRMHHEVSDSFESNQFFQIYASMVGSYTKRELSFSSDILNAFQGIMKRLERTYGIQFIYALPQSQLVCALLWQPATKLIRRRINGCGKSCDYTIAMEVTTLPSWTWAAWEGNVFYESELSERDSAESKIVWDGRTKPNPEGNPIDNFMNSPGVLRFWTTSATFCITKADLKYDISEISRVKCGYASNSLRYALITDQKSKAAGEMIVDTSCMELPTKAAEFILICRVRSFSRHVWEDGYGGRSKDIHVTDESFGAGAKIREILKKETKDWTYYKVMLVTRVEGYVQRVGVGTIDINAWESHCSELEFIQLI